MKSAEKLHVLQNALQGNTTLLHQYKQQYQQKTAPYLDAHGIIDFHHCPEGLLTVKTSYDYYPTLSKTEQRYQSVAECLQLYQQTDPKLRFLFRAGCTLIDLDDQQYDDQPLAFIQIWCRDYKERFIEGGTIADLRHWYNQSEAAYRDSSYLALFFEENAERFDWHRQNPFTESTKQP